MEEYNGGLIVHEAELLPEMEQEYLPPMGGRFLVGRLELLEPAPLLTPGQRVDRYRP